MRTAAAFGARQSASIATWRRGAREVVEEAGFRRDLTSTLLGVIDGLASAYRARDKRSAPGHDVLAERTGRHKGTIGRAMTQLADMGLLFVAYEGTIVWDGDVTRNLRAEYVLTLPGRPSDAPAPNPRAVLDVVPKGRRARHAAARAIQKVSEGNLSGISAAALASELRVWFEAGWTPAEILRGLDYGPDGAWTFTTAPRDVRAWLRFRLSHHKDGEGQPLPSPSTRTEARRAATKEALREARRDRGRGAPSMNGTARSALAAARTALADTRLARRYRATPQIARNVDPSSSFTLGESPTSRAKQAETLDAAPRAAWTNIEERIEHMRRAQLADKAADSDPLHSQPGAHTDSPHLFLECSRQERPTPLTASASA